MCLNYSKQVKRNIYVDIVRGIAMLLVILGHTITGCTEESESSFIFNIIWSLQMPLFILVSGYVTRYSRKVETSAALWGFIKRRTYTYLFPWIIWTFFVRGLIFKKTHLFNIKWLIYHMDAGYWFLTTIWTISLIFCLCSFISSKINQSNEIVKHILTLLFYCLGMAIVAGIGLLMGMSFLGIRLTLYYMPFYYVGYIYGQYRDNIQQSKYGIKISEIVITLCFILWLYILFRVPLYFLSDGLLSIIIRVVASLSGSIAVCGLCKGFFNTSSDILTPQSDDNKISSKSDINNTFSRENLTLFTIWKNSVVSFLLWSGRFSLELYVIHGLLLNLIKVEKIPVFLSVEGFMLSVGNYIITLALSSIVILLLGQNEFLCKILGMRLSNKNGGTRK